MLIPSDALNITAYYTWMGEDGIGRTAVKHDIDVTLDHAIENSKAVTSLYKDKKFPLLIDARGIKSMSYEARHHFSAQGRDIKPNSFGIIIGSSISRVLGNFFLGIHKPIVPTKLFVNEEEAITWLKKFC